MRNYILVAIACAVVILYLHYFQSPVFIEDGYYEIEPSFAELASLENMSLLVNGDSGILTILSEEPQEILFDIDGSVFVSDTDSPLTNQELTFVKSNCGVLDVYSNEVHVASFVKDNMVSLQLKK